MTETYFLRDTDFDEYLNELTEISDPLLDPEEENLCDDSTLFDELKDKYGSIFEKLNRRQKLYLLVCVASDLCCEVVSDEEDDITNPQITELTNKLHKELSTVQKENFMQSLVSQVRHNKGE